MSPSPRSESNGGDALLAIIAGALIGVVIVEATLVAVATWWLLGLALLTVVGAAIVVVFAVVHLIDNDTPVPTLPRTYASQPKPQPHSATSRRTALSR